MRIRLLSHLILVVAVITAIGGCSSMRRDFVKPPSSALPPASDTPSSRYVASELTRHDGLSGFRLLTKSTNALMSRVALIDQASHSIDLQYFIFKNDATGRLIALHLLAAADRGVRVRILLDDVHLDDEDVMFNALDAHPSIQVRLFNPFRTRHPTMLSKLGQFALEGARLNRRMHNKSFIVDNAVAIIGGRNIGDDYFDAGSDTNFRDLDLIAIGPVVQEASRSFDAYWNCDAAYPATAFRTTRDTHADLSVLRVKLVRDARAFAQSDYAQEIADEFPHGGTGDRRGGWFWGPASFIADRPEKIEAPKGAPFLRVGPKLKAMMDAARVEVVVISPYFVPGDKGSRYLVNLAQHGVSVKVLTNSLASTDEPAAHSGYVHYRRRLLEGGVDLYELRPALGAAQPATARGTSSGVSLHAKAMIVDQSHVFIGSLNMDPRSKLLNTEMGLIVDSPELADAVKQFFDIATQPGNAFHVVLRGTPGVHSQTTHMQWLSEKNGVIVSNQAEPGATTKRRIEVLALRILPIEGLL